MRNALPLNPGVVAGIHEEAVRPGLRCSRRAVPWAASCLLACMLSCGDGGQNGDRSESTENDHVEIDPRPATAQVADHATVAGDAGGDSSKDAGADAGDPGAAPTPAGRAARSYPACVGRPGMSTPAERRKCGRKARSTTVANEATCLCVAGAVLQIPPDANRKVTDVTLEAIELAKSEFPASEFGDEKPISKVYVARFSRVQPSQSKVHLWIDLPATPPTRFWGRSRAKGMPMMPGHNDESHWGLDFGVHDKSRKLVGLGLLVFPEEASFVVLTER